MKTLVIGHTGLIGSKVFQQLKAKGYDVVGASHKTTPALDINSPNSIRDYFHNNQKFQHVIVTTGAAFFGNFYDMQQKDFEVGLHSKLMGQIIVTLEAFKQTDVHSVTLTSGTLSHNPIPGSAGAAFVNGALDSFVKAVNLDLKPHQRLNIVSPGWIKETMVEFGMDPTSGYSVDEVSQLYIKAIESNISGKVFESGNFRKLEHANLVVTNLEETKKFLLTAFPEWKERGRGTGTWGEKERTWLHIGTDDYYITLNDNGDGLNRDLQGHQPGLAHIGFVVEDCDKVLQRLNNAGYELRTTGADPYRKSYYFIDPQGFEFEFLEYSTEDPKLKNQYESDKLEVQNTSPLSIQI